MKRIIIILVIIVVLAAIAALILTFLTQRESNKNANFVNQLINQNFNLNQNVNVGLNTNTTNVSAEAGELTLEQIASVYAERYGSYSNQSNFENLESLKAWMSKSLKETTDKYIQEQRKKLRNISTYEEFITRSLVTEVLTQSEEKAEVLVSTQRTKFVDDKESVYYQDLLLAFIKEDGQWKVNQALWQD